MADLITVTRGVAVMRSRDYPAEVPASIEREARPMHYLTSAVPDLRVARVRRHLAGLPAAGDYSVAVVPLDYDDKPSLSGWTHFDERRITIEIPHPFIPFGDVVPYGAKRRPGADGMRFTWLTEGVTFRTPREVLRFVYLHEWMHWYLAERLGKKSRAETTCDRFALWNYRRKLVTEADARAALSRRSSRSDAVEDAAAQAAAEVAQLSLSFTATYGDPSDAAATR